VGEFTERINTLAGIVGQEFIKPQPDIIAKYAVDNTMPKVVLFPASTQQVADVVRYANQENLAIVPWPWATRQGAWIWWFAPPA
jgi:hypothetical protein